MSLNADLGRDFEYTPGFLSPSEADDLAGVLWQEMDWKQQEILLFSRKVMQPRLTAWCSDPGISYRYSGLLLSPAPWHERLDRLRRSLKRSSGSGFNSVLLNAYRDGSDSMGWHADNEPELGQYPHIASISLGATRRFLVRPSGGGKSFGLDLEHGSLLLMKGASQENWQHSIPKTTRQTGLRINLTFRKIRK